VTGLDIASISGIVAAGGVVVGVVFAYLELRSLARDRHTELLHTLYSTIRSKDFVEAWEKVRNREAIGYEDYKKKYGFVEYNQIMTAIEEIGVLVEEKLIDLHLVEKLFKTFIKIGWEKMKPINEDAQRVYNNPDMNSSAKYIYNEIMKREQAQQAKE